MQVDPEGLMGARSGVSGRGIFLTGEEVWGEGYVPPRKNGIFHLKWRVIVHSEQYFLSVSLPEKC